MTAISCAIKVHLLAYLLPVLAKAVAYNYMLVKCIGAVAIYPGGARAPPLSRVGAGRAQGRSTCKCSAV